MIFLLWLCGAALLQLSQCLGASTTVIPATTVSGPSNPAFTSSSGGLDGPHLAAVNSTGWQWWYFDAVAPDINSSIVIVFFAAAPEGFPFADDPIVTNVQAYISYPDGTQDEITIDADHATVVTDGQGASGSWAGAGSDFEGTPDLSSYTINIQSANISGTMTLKSTAPAHYPCGVVKAGKSMEIGPGLGWANAIPDSNAEVDFTLNDKRIQFSGAGYTDQNWAGQALFDVTAGWYWGHGRVGDYSIVWFSELDVSKTEHVSAYVAKNGEVLTAECKPGSIVVRPMEGAYPPPAPSANSTLPTGYHIVIDLGSKGIMSLDVNAVDLVLDAPPYVGRWAGSINGTISGAKNNDRGHTEYLSHGYALFEQFILS